MTYLPPIQTPITEYPKMVSLFEISRKLAKNANMMYTDIIVDVVWNDADY